MNYKGYSSTHGLNADGFRRLGNQLQFKASKAVENNMIVLSSEDIFNIAVCLRRYDRRFLKLIIEELSVRFKWSKYMNVTVCHFNPETRNMIIWAIEATASSKSEYETLAEITRWYGIQRFRVEKLKEFAIEDPRSRWDDVYDGTSYKELTYGDIHIDTTEEEEQAEWLKAMCLP